MKTRVRSPRRRAVLILGSAALGAAVLGIRFMLIGANEVSEPGIAIGVRPIWMLVGALMGGALGALFVYRGRFMNKLPTRPPADTERFTRRTVGLLVGSILLAVCVWLAFMGFVIGYSKSLAQVELKSFAVLGTVFSIVLSWVLLGRRSAWSRRVEHALMLGPFRYWLPSRLTIPQLKVLWPSVVLLGVLFLFPPRVAYESAINGVGHGGRTFVGFHLILSSERDVLGDSPLSWLETNWILTIALAGLVAIGAAILMVVRAERAIRPEE